MRTLVNSLFLLPLLGLVLIGSGRSENPPAQIVIFDPVEGFSKGWTAGSWKDLLVEEKCEESRRTVCGLRSEATGEYSALCLGAEWGDDGGFIPVDGSAEQPGEIVVELRAGDFSEGINEGAANHLHVGVGVVFADGTRTSSPAFRVQDEHVTESSDGKWETVRIPLADILDGMKDGWSVTGIREVFLQQMGVATCDIVVRKCVFERK